MIFKNAHIYRLGDHPSGTFDQLPEKLQQWAFKPCTGVRPSSFGWVEPVAEAGLVHEVAGCYLLCAKREDKVVPLAVSIIMLDLLPNADLHVFSRCGHWTQIERADEFSALVATYLERS